MTQTGRHLQRPDEVVTGRRSRSADRRWLAVSASVLVLGLVALAVGAWAVSRPNASVTPWGLGGGVIAGPVLIAIAIAELIRRGVAGRHERGRHSRH